MFKIENNTIIYSNLDELLLLLNKEEFFMLNKILNKYNKEEKEISINKIIEEEINKIKEDKNFENSLEDKLGLPNFYEIACSLISKIPNIKKYLIEKNKNSIEKIKIEKSIKNSFITEINNSIYFLKEDYLNNKDIINISYNKSLLNKLNETELFLITKIILEYRNNKEKISWYYIIDKFAGKNEIKRYSYIKTFYSLLNKYNWLWNYIEENIEKFDVSKEEILTKKEDNKKENVDYIIDEKNEKWEIIQRNLLFELIEKASKDMKFLFWNNYKFHTAKNIKAFQSFYKKLKLNNISIPSFKEISQMYTIFIERVFSTAEIWKQNNINPFIKFLEDIYINWEKENIWNKIRGIQVYLQYKWIKKSKSTLTQNYFTYSDTVLSILKLIWDTTQNLEKFTKLLNEFSTEFKQIWYSWNLKTVLKKLWDDKKYIKYIKTEEDNNKEEDNNILLLDNKNIEQNTKDSSTKKENKTVSKKINKELKNFIKENDINENDNEIIEMLLEIYNKDWIEWVKNMF